jgi:hypothetical protein
MAEHGPEKMVDPTENILNLVQEAIKRQDDLRAAADRHSAMAAKHVEDIAALRADYDAQLRKAETARIDAIRAVDVGAVNRAAEVSAQQAMTLAAQVAASAETLRSQVAAAATAATAALAAALDPIQKDIADLRKTQYEQAGQRTQVGESRLNLGSLIGVVGALIGVVLFVVSLLR